MIKVRVAGPDGGGEVERRAQIISAGPPGLQLTHWARTADDLPGEWLLVKEHRDRITGKIEYTAVAGNAGLGEYRPNP